MINKSILITLIGFGLVGCAISNLYISEEPRMPNTKYGVWNYDIIKDEFNGQFAVSAVLSDGKALLRVASSKQGYRLDYLNGDSYLRY